MFTIRKSEERGKANFGWLDAKYSFSFSQYFDANHTGFSDLLVINQDIIEPSSGFGKHPHKDMEIITYIIRGAIEHEDSIGNKGIIQKGEIQRMSAGSGIIHSEYNPSNSEATELLQIWIQTAEKGIEADYENIRFDEHKGLKLLVTPNGENNTARIHQDFYLHSGNFSDNESVEVNLGKGRRAWIQVVDGMIDVNGTEIGKGDGLAISETEILKIKTIKNSEFLLMNLR